MTKNPNRIEVYLIAEDRQKLVELGDKLDAAGVDVRYKRNPKEVSLSKVIRWLIHKELTNTPKSGGESA